MKLGMCMNHIWDESSEPFYNFTGSLAMHFKWSGTELNLGPGPIRIRGYDQTAPGSGKDFPLYV